MRFCFWTASIPDGQRGFWLGLVVKTVVGRSMTKASSGSAIDTNGWSMEQSGCYINHSPLGVDHQLASSSAT